MSAIAFVGEKNRTPVCQVASDTHVGNTTDSHTQILHCYCHAVVTDVFVKQTFLIEVSSISKHKSDLVSKM